MCVTDAYSGQPGVNRHDWIILKTLRIAVLGYRPSTGLGHRDQKRYSARYPELIQKTSTEVLVLVCSVDRDAKERESALFELACAFTSDAVHERSHLIERPII